MDQADLSDLSAVIDRTLSQIEAVSASQARFETVVRDLEESWRVGRAAHEESTRRVDEFTVEVQRLRQEGTEGWQTFLRGVTSDLERQRDKQLRRWAGLEARVQEALDGLHDRWEARWGAFTEKARAEMQSHLEQQAGEAAFIAQTARDAWAESVERLTADCAELQSMINDDLGRMQAEVKKALTEVRSEARTHAVTSKKRHQEVMAEVEKAEAAQAKVLKDVNVRLRALADQVKETDHVIAAVDGRVQQVVKQRGLTDTTVSTLARRIDLLTDEAAQNRQATEELGQHVQALAASVQRLESRLGSVTDQTLPALQDELQRLGGSPLLRLLGGRRKPGTRSRGETD